MSRIRIISGGQTGVDRAALDAALHLKLDCGGYCPAGRAAEDGPIHSRYPLEETESDDPAVRTRLNVRDSDATLVISPAPLRGGTALTQECAVALARPCLVVRPDDPEAIETVLAWIREHGIIALNVAGPRESEFPGIYEAAIGLLIDILGVERP